MLGSLYDFAKGMGKKLFTTDAEAGLNILQHLEANNPGVKPIDVKFDDGVVTLSGVAKTAVAKEKAILMAGNVEGVEKVIADDIEVDEPIPTIAPAATPSTAASAETPSVEFPGVLPGTRYYEIQKGDTLYAIAKEFYGNGMKYPEIFEANREVIEDPDKIYPGQKIRIPVLD
ncbi:MAG: peptidoglycan-binding protein LysM [Pseudomonadota bacterium]